MRGRLLAGIAALLLLALPLAACGGDDGDGDLSEVTIGLSFVPNIQFVPFYIADAKGFYEDEGVKVTFNHHGVGADLFAALVAGQETMMMAGGDEVLQARGSDVPLVYVAEVFTSYPVGLIVPADSDIMSVADLRGHSVGIPGAYGANYLGLLALLDSAGLTEDDVTVESVGFTQASALLAGHVDAVMGYMNNEPIQIEKAGMPVRTFPVSEVQPLVSNGLVALEEKLADDPETVEAIVAATLRGVQYAIDNPEEAVEIARDFVPTLTTDENLADARAVLDATLPMWAPTGEPGASEPTSWDSMLAFFADHGIVSGDIDLSAVYSNEYLPD